MLKYVTLGAFIAFSGRLVVLGASIGDAMALGALAALYGFSLYLESVRQAPLNDQVKKELEELKTSVASLKLGRSMGR